MSTSVSSAISPGWLSLLHKALGSLQLKMRGQMGTEKGTRGILTLTAVGSHLLFVNSDMWLPAMYFKLGEMCRSKLSVQMTTLSWYPPSAHCHVNSSVILRQGWKRGQRRQGAFVKGALASLLES
jgi:hypothetical protein